MMMRDDRVRQRLRAERPRLVDDGLRPCFVQRRFEQHQVIGELEDHAAMVAGAGQPPDALANRLGGDDNRGRRRRRCGLHGVGRRQIAGTAIDRVLRDLQVELQVLVDVGRQTLRQFQPVHLLVTGERRRDGDVAHVGVVGHRRHPRRQLGRAVHRQRERVALGRRDVDELFASLLTQIGNPGGWIERGSHDGRWDGAAARSADRAPRPHRHGSHCRPARCCRRHRRRGSGSAVETASSRTGTARCAIAGRGCGRSRGRSCA